MIDCFFFFYQWQIKTAHWHCLAIISHRDQKVFKITVIEFQNSSFYVQQIINQIFQSHYKYVKAYIDNIVIFFKSLLKYINYLNAVLSIFERLDIILKLIKFFFDYLSVQLLEQKIDALNLTIFINKLWAISELEFSKSLKDLEIYLDMTEYLQQYIFCYAQVSALL